MLRDDHLCAGVQVAGACVVAEPGPQFEHVGELRCREAFDRGEALQEARVIGRDRPHCRLLQHDFGEPYPIRLGCLPGLGAPRQLRRWRSYQASRSAARGPAPARFRRTDVPASVISTDRVAERNQVNKPRRIVPSPTGRASQQMPLRCIRPPGFCVARDRHPLAARSSAARSPPMPSRSACNGRAIRKAASQQRLVLRVEGPAAVEIQHQSGLVIERVNRFFGWRAVDRLALRQAPLRGPRKRPLPARHRCRRRRSALQGRSPSRMCRCGARSGGSERR